MVIKQQIPTWSVVVAIVLVVALVAGFLMTMNPGNVDKDASIKLRTKPGSQTAMPPQQYGMPRGIPIIPGQDPNAAAGAMSRNKPAQG